jgi:hypothetical protein
MEAPNEGRRHVLIPTHRDAGHVLSAAGDNPVRQPCRDLAGCSMYIGNLIPQKLAAQYHVDPDTDFTQSVDRKPAYDRIGIVVKHRHNRVCLMNQMRESVAKMC